MSVTNRKLSDFKKMLITLIMASMVSLYILSAGGCDFGRQEIVKETSEPSFLRGQDELKRGNVNEAMTSFMKVTEKRKDAPESHFELGRIYLDNMNDQISAIYHFRKYLELKPNSQASPIVRQMIETAQKRMIASLPESPYENNIRKLELEEILQKVQRENLELQQKLNAANLKIDKLESTQTVNVAKSEPQKSTQTNSKSDSVKSSQVVKTSSEASKIDVKRDTPRTYTVQPGDTLSSISRKVYGTPNKWRDIYGANRDRMPTPEALKPGQSLRIPRQ